MRPTHRLFVVRGSDASTGLYPLSRSATRDGHHGMLIEGWRARCVVMSFKRRDIHDPVPQGCAEPAPAGPKSGAAKRKAPGAPRVGCRGVAQHACLLQLRPCTSPLCRYTQHPTPSSATLRPSKAYTGRILGVFERTPCKRCYSDAPTHPPSPSLWVVPSTILSRVMQSVGNTALFPPGQQECRVDPGRRRLHDTGVATYVKGEM